MAERPVIVYGDHPNPRPARAVYDDLLTRADRDPRALLIDLGQLQQAVVDRAFDARGRVDDWGDLERAFGTAALAVARRLGGEPVDAAPALRALAPFVPNETLELKTPEGYAYYALYPELYLEAARRWARARPGVETCVIGLRSIGTGLAAAVAAGLGHRRPPLTVRPTGHVFARTLRLSPTLTSYLSEQAAHVHFALVDEGPGLSGSSFGGVADWLEDHGIAPERIHVFCGHAGGLGTRASERHRARWDRVDRAVLTLDDVLRDLPRGGRLREISGGDWRRELYPCESVWPAAWRQREARKFVLARGGGRPPLFAKFNGLDGASRDKVGRARALGEAGLSPRVRGAFNGFLLQDWLGDARPLPLASVPRARAVGRLAEYLIFRVRHFPVARAAHGPDELLGMITHNFATYFRPAVLADDGELAHLVHQAARQPLPLFTDGRLHPWEWLVTPAGRILKTDAVDHGRAHDCVGAQDLAWDVAGALYEFDLDDGEFDLLLWMLKGVVPAGVLGPEKLRFFRYAYLAFQLGSYAMAADQAAGDAGEWLRLKTRALKYAQHLTDLVAPRLGRSPSLRLSH